MSQRSTFHPPRFLPDRPFPLYAYVPGHTPHPTRDPDGHSYGAAFEMPEPPDPQEWRACRDYLYGIDLFNHGFYWEAHEVWEGLWVACGRRGPNLPAGVAAAGLKARSGSERRQGGSPVRARIVLPSGFLAVDYRALARAAL
jgi:uncharacterized protein